LEKIEGDNVDIVKYQTHQITKKIYLLCENIKKDDEESEMGKI